MAAAEMQSAIMQRAADLREELADLTSWEKEMKQKDAALRAKKVDIEADLPVIRGTPKPAAPAKPKEDPIQVAKEQGNEYFKVHKYDDAIRCYSRGIERDPQSASSYLLYGNRAMCHLKLEQWEQAEKDATTCIQMNRTYPKGFFRRALARKSLKKYADARSDLETLLVLVPQDPDGEREMKEVSKLLAEQKAKEASSGGGAPKKKKKKLVIEEVDDGEEDAAAAAAERKRKEEAEAEENRRRIAADEAAQKAKHEADRKRAAQAEEAKRQSQRKINSRIEELDDEESPKKPEPKKPAEAKKHVDPAATSPPKKAAAEPAVAPKKFNCQYTLQTLPVPRNFSEFERLHTEVLQDPELVDHLFLSIPSNTWKTLFGMSMTAEMLLDCLGSASRVSPTDAATILTGLATVQNLEDCVLFFEDSDRALIQKAMERAGSNINSSALSVLKRKLL